MLTGRKSKAQCAREGEDKWERAKLPARGSRYVHALAKFHAKNPSPEEIQRANSAEARAKLIRGVIP